MDVETKKVTKLSSSPYRYTYRNSCRIDTPMQFVVNAVKCCRVGSGFAHQIDDVQFQVRRCVHRLPKSAPSPLHRSAERFMPHQQSAYCAAQASNLQRPIYTAEYGAVQCRIPHAVMIQEPQEALAHGSGSLTDRHSIDGHLI